MEQNFIHLRLHTAYSLSDGLLSIPALLTRACQYRMGALGISDQSNLYAAIKFYQEAIRSGIKPIIGVDMNLSGDQHLSAPARITLICKNNQGYSNLLQLVSKAYLEGQETGRPLIQRSWLADYAEGLIVLMGAEAGDIGQALISKDPALANTYLNFYQEYFPDHFYIEISRVGKQSEAFYIPEALKFAETFNLPVVATNDMRFLDRSDFDAHEAKVCIQKGVTLTDPHRERIYTEQQFFKSAKEMQTLFSDIPEALTNTVEIAKRCNVSFTLGQYLLPHYKVPENLSTETYLTQVAKEGLGERLQTLKKAKPTVPLDQKQYEARLDRELSVINKMGFAGYFLIVADFTRWAKENGIPVGPGRGSGPGSLVSFALKITDLDPIALDLLFERFLNPERVSMPDFDIDFCVIGRDRVIDYVMQKNGHDRVSHIITYGTMAAKAVVRDVGRVLGMGYGYVDKIAKLIPFEIGMTLEKALQQEPLLLERYEKEEEVRTLIELARKLEGLTRNVGKHAGGIVIAPGKLTEFVPLYCEPHEAMHPITQFDKDDVETVGLVKFDFLGLKTLTIIDRSIKVINDTLKKQKKPLIDINLIPLNDVKTFQLLKQFKSTAVFQLESHGMRDLIKRLQPDCFEDLIALVALFRPGPLQSGMVDDFINRKHGRAKVIYPNPKLEPILRPTYGVILYQEQVMQIAQVLAGYTLGAADILRRAMGKKKPEEMAKQREIFCKGAIARGVHEEVATHIFDLMEKFAGYGFNKSHSASYALIAYQTAWLKTHYPSAFMAAVMSLDMDRTEKILIYLEECQSLKIHVTPPDVNQSQYAFKALDKENIMYGLGAIKGAGEAAIDNIIRARDKNGLFENLFEFCKQVDLRKVNRRVLEALIKSGAFDCFQKNRATLTASLHHALLQAEQTAQNELYGQHDLLSMDTTNHNPAYHEQEKWNEELQLQGEKETLGFYLSGHPINKYINELAHFVSGHIAGVEPKSQQSVRLAGIITATRTRQTKRGDRMAIYTLDDGTGQMEAVCFSDQFQKFKNLLIKDQLIVAEGEISFDDFNHQPKLVTRELYSFDEARSRFIKTLKIHLKDFNQFKIEKFKTLLSTHAGSCPVVLSYRDENIQTDLKLSEKWAIKPLQSFINIMKEEFLVEEVSFQYE